jgi:peptidoglycan hydrolase CwlO-like protein
MRRLCFVISILLIFSLNSCKFVKDVLAYEYLKNFNNKTSKSIDSINKKLIDIENLIEINENSIEKLKQEMSKLEGKNEEN